MKFRKNLLSVANLRLVFAVVSLVKWARSSPVEMPSSRGRRAGIRNPHVDNFHRVSEDLYRSAQPSANGFKELQRLGIRTIINLRSWHSNAAVLKDTTLHSEKIEMTAAFPRDEQVVQFLRIIRNKANAPFLVHCYHGSDRTGTMTAVYRMVIQGWSKDEAVAEMTRGGFGFHNIWSMTLVRYLREMNLDLLKERAGLTSVLAK
jgi:protein tyrosine/serine phosphatase